MTKENDMESNTVPTQSGETVSQGLHGVRQAARRNNQERFTALLHHVTITRLRDSFYALKRKAAAGVDGMRWEEYETELESRLEDLHGRVHRGSYRPKPARRRWIPKANGKQRPLGIAALEDKIVQRAVVNVLEAIYEEDFRDFSYGFRPGRDQHRALDALYVAIKRKKVNWILDLDIRSFFDRIDHECLKQLIEYRIADQRVHRLIQKWLKAGVLEDGEWKETEAGAAQGSVISPLLSNIYLHYVIDQWSDQWRQTAKGDVTIVRYADDAILGFQHEWEAKNYLRALRKRLQQFGLELNEEKTKLIRFGRFAEKNLAEREKGKPETFTFLGFQHICAKTKQGHFEIRRITEGKRRRQKLQEIKQELRRRMHEPVAKVGKWLQKVLNGYYQYHGVSGNLSVLAGFRLRVARLWHNALKRRSQRRPKWTQLKQIFTKWLPKPKVVHEYPNVRFDARHPKMSLHPR